jgi:hypothetical protein
MLQVFALDNDEVVRHVDEVERGLACGCRCPVCHQPVMAKQGEIKEWHFAHASGADCLNAGETALHMAAKQILLSERGLTVPEVVLSANYKLPDGREGSATVRRSEAWIDMIDVKSEVRFGNFKPDIVGYFSGSIIFIEIAVSHFVDDEKRSKLADASVATLEINLSAIARDEVSWSTLKEAVIDSVENKHWIIELEKSHLQAEALEMAMSDALSKVLVLKPQASMKPVKHGFVIDGRRLNVTEYPFGLVVWFQFDEKVKNEVKKLAHNLGGRYSPQHRNWLFRTDSKPYLIDALSELERRDLRYS